MSSEFSRDHLKIALAKILQTIGWHSINTTPLEVLADILGIFITRVAKTTASYSNEFRQTVPNLDHLALAFREHGVSLQELEEYVSFVNFAQGPAAVPKYPIPKENHLNFLKPGSKEVVTRPVHIHEHLPPMHSLTEEVSEENDPAVLKPEVLEETIQENIQIFKRPIDISPSEFKRSNLRREEDLSRPTREISSVMMTTSGFLSPAREGRLPESRTPAPPPPEPQSQPPEPPQPSAAQIPAPVGQPIAPPPVCPPAPAVQSKRPKVARKSQKGKKERVGRELFKATAKEGTKIKKGMVQAALGNGLEVIPSQVPMIPKHVSQNKANKALAAARLKTEKLNTTITPIPIKQNIAEGSGPNLDVDKLFTEPNKKKLNILKKISNVKDAKLNTSNKKEEKMDAGLVISESNDVTCKLKSIPCDLTIEPINSPLKLKREPPDFSIFNMNTAAASKTDIVQMSANGKPKRKRKPRAPKQKLQLASDMGLDMSQSKVPEPSMLIPKQEPGVFPQLGSQMPPMPLSYPFLQPFGGPGLIPSLIPSNPIFPFNINPMRYLPPPKMPFVRNPLAQSIFKPPPGDELHISMEKTSSLQSHTQLSPKASHHQDDYIKNEPSPVGLMIDEEPVEMTSKSLGEVVRAPEVKQEVNYDQVSSTNTNTVVQDTGSDVISSTSMVTTEKKSKEHKKDKKDRLKKKNKKDKVKSKADKAEKKKLKEEKRDKEKLKKEKKEKRKELQQQHMRVSESLVPKITLKIGSPPRSATPEMKKLNIKPVVRRDDEPSSIPSWEERKREPSPGLAKISALVTGPPKPKNTTITPAYNSIPSTSHDNNQKRLKPIPKIRTKELIREPILEIASTPPSKYVVSNVITVEENVKEEQHITPVRNHPGPGRPRIHPVKPKSPPKTKKRRTPIKKDAEGNEVWICPACGRQDDGSPMIGCDDCDAWYHWVCVGIQVPPDENENWYCRHCLMKKDEDLQGDKKKKRKKRDKKDN